MHDIYIAYIDSSKDHIAIEFNIDGFAMDSVHFVLF